MIILNILAIYESGSVACLVSSNCDFFFPFSMLCNEMVGWDHQLSGHEYEQTLGDGKVQGSLECCIPWGCRVRHDKQLNNNMLCNFTIARHDILSKGTAINKPLVI